MTTDDQPTFETSLEGPNQTPAAGNVLPFRRPGAGRVTPAPDRIKSAIARSRPRRQPKLGNQIRVARNGASKRASSNNAKAGRGSRKIRRAGLSQAQIQQIGVDTIGQRMTQSRLKLNLTQEEVAARVMITSKSGELSGVERPLSRNAYCMYERDFVEPSFANLASIAKVLDVKPAWLAFGEGKVIDL